MIGSQRADSPSSTVRGYLTRIERVMRSVGRDLARRHPSARASLVRAWELYVETYARLVCWKHSLLYARRTELSPFEVVSVDPDEIEYLVDGDGYPQQTRAENAFPSPRFRFAGSVHGGDWDRREVRFEETELYRGFEAHFERGVDWEDTAFFGRVVELIDDGIEMWGCTTRQEFEQRCVDLDVLYDSIRSRGYRSQRELGRTGHEDPLGDQDASWVLRLVYDEMAVCVGREGDLLFLDGRNRLAIAKLLDLDSIPVWILVRHEGWQAFRERLAETPSLCEDLPPGLRAHPDVRKILAREGGD